MELPILYALTHPDRVPDPAIAGFDPTLASGLTFEPVDSARFPALRIGLAAGARGGCAPAIFNAANEAAVCLFLDGKISFGDIARAVDSALESPALDPGAARTEPARARRGAPDIDELTTADAAARAHVRKMFGKPERGVDPFRAAERSTG